MLNFDAFTRSKYESERNLKMEKVVGATLHRNILCQYSRMNQPKLIADVVVTESPANAGISCPRD